MVTLGDFNKSNWEAGLLIMKEPWDSSLSFQWDIIIKSCHSSFLCNDSSFTKSQRKYLFVHCSSNEAGIGKEVVGSDKPKLQPNRGHSCRQAQTVPLLFWVCDSQVQFLFESLNRYLILGFCLPFFSWFYFSLQEHGKVRELLKCTEK